MCIFTLIKYLFNCGIEEKTALHLFIGFGIGITFLGILLFIMTIFTTVGYIVYFVPSIVLVIGLALLGMGGFGYYLRYKEKKVE